MEEKYIKGKVLKIISKYRIVINKGLEDNIKNGQNCYVFELGEDIIDPDNGEVIEKLEIFKGQFKIVHVQDKISTAQVNEFYTENSSLLNTMASIASFTSSNKSRKTIANTENLTDDNDNIKRVTEISIGDLVKIQTNS